MKRDYVVSIDVCSTHQFRVDNCNSPEEAESIAEGLLAEGETGEVTETDVIDVTTLEADEEVV